MKRTELEDLSKPILKRIKETIEKTIKEGGSYVDHFLLIGNATKMPAVRELVEKTIRAKHLMGIDPGTAVATGAALEGASISGDIKETLLLDVVPYSLGIAVLRKESKTSEEEISKLIEKNTTIPTRKSSNYTTTKDNQTEVRIKIYQGESEEPYKNYFLGDFVLSRIIPAPAGTPKIEVAFDIDVDCILTVTAKDQVAGNTQSIRIEGAITLSPVEKQNLSQYFAESENIHSLEKDLEKIRMEINNLESSCDNATRTAECSIKDFFEIFHEKIEVNTQFYRADRNQTKAIQNMFIQKDQFIYGIPKYKDQFSSIIKNLRQIESKHFDFSDKDIISKM